jgi:hypothetical protein
MSWKTMSLVSLSIASILCANTNAQVKHNDSEAIYSGPISHEKNHLFFSQIAGRDISRLVIKSSGGDVEAGIELGRWVFQNKINVIVSGYCFSSCANYVFTAGSRKIIRPDSLVAWHGNYHHLLSTGLWRDDINSRMMRTNENLQVATDIIRKQVSKLVKLEKDFFKLIGVNQYICWVGKMPPYNAKNYYSMSVSDMSHFGVTDVTSPDDYLQTDLNRFKDSIVFIALHS